jgi:hypothetical protein
MQPKRVGDRLEWVLNGKYHRKDGPAIEYDDGGKRWIVFGKAHRLDGPAEIYPGKFRYWHIYGRHHHFVNDDERAYNESCNSYKQILLRLLYLRVKYSHAG